MKTIRSTLITCALLTLCSAASAQIAPASNNNDALGAIADHRAREASAALVRLEGNLITGEAIVMQGSQLDNRMEQTNSRRRVLDTEISQHNEYCSGSFQSPEYERRVARCGTWGAGLRSRGNEIDMEQESLRQQGAILQGRENQRVVEAEQITLQFGGAYAEWRLLCAQMQVQCTPLPSAGPRSAPFLAQVQAGVERFERQCATVRVLEQKVECLRQVFDGNVYDPNRHVVTEGLGTRVVPNE